jgi:hypothetical protein
MLYPVVTWDRCCHLSHWMYSELTDQTVPMLLVVWVFFIMLSPVTRLCIFSVGMQFAAVWFVKTARKGRRLAPQTGALTPPRAVRFQFWGSFLFPRNFYWCPTLKIASTPALLVLSGMWIRCALAFLKWRIIELAPPALLPYGLLDPRTHMQLLPGRHLRHDRLS